MLPSRMIGLRGPKFFEGQDGPMFVNYFDAFTRDGPREATKEDSEAHPAAWAKFAAELQGEAQDGPSAPQATFVDPPGGAPPREASTLASRRDAARRRGEAA